MEIRITIPLSGNFKCEHISILEDLWEDYLYFKKCALRYDTPGLGHRAGFRARRYSRVCLLLLMSYLEGVVNHWGYQLLSGGEYPKWKGEPLHRKIEDLERLTAKVKPRGVVDMKMAKSLRNKLVHLKPGNDLLIYDAVTVALIEGTEKAATSWLEEIERRTGFSRHPDTRASALELAAALGEITSEAHSD